MHDEENIDSEEKDVYHGVHGDTEQYKEES